MESSVGAFGAALCLRSAAAMTSGCGGSGGSGRAGGCSSVSQLHVGVLRYVLRVMCCVLRLLKPHPLCVEHRSMYRSRKFWYCSSNNLNAWASAACISSRSCSCASTSMRKILSFCRDLCAASCWLMCDRDTSSTINCTCSRIFEKLAWVSLHATSASTSAGCSRRGLRWSGDCEGEIFAWILR